MRRALLACLAASAWVVAGASQAAEWRVQRVDIPARVTAIETVGGKTQVNAGGLWYSIVLAGERATLGYIETPAKPKRPDGALPDAIISTGTRDIARAWLAEPTTRYDHGILGDEIEAGSLVIEARDGKRYTVQLGSDAVFEDLEPRLADLDGDGHDEIIVVKSYLKRGSSLAVIALHEGRYRDRRRNAAARPRRGAGSTRRHRRFRRRRQNRHRAGAPAAYAGTARIVELA